MSDLERIIAEMREFAPALRPMGRAMVERFANRLAALAGADPVACGGCGETDAEKRCIGCMHQFTHALAGAAPVAWDTKEMVEVAAKAIFENWNFGAPVAWVPRGNSLKQTEARAYAREAIDAIIAAAPHAPAKAREDDAK